MLFSPSASSDNNIVIVPPKPDASLLHQDEFSYGSLYTYGEYEPSMVAVDSSMSSMSFSSSQGAAMGSSAVDPSDPALVKDVSSGFDDELKNINSASMDEMNTERRNSDNSLLIQRDPRNGAFTFQVHAEYDLLLHVQKDLDRYHRKDHAHSSAQDVLKPTQIIMKSIDNYCLCKQWMYHIGFEKAVAVRNFIQCSVKDFIAKHSDELNNQQVKKFLAVDLGTSQAETQCASYCG